MLNKSVCTPTKLPTPVNQPWDQPPLQPREKVEGRTDLTPAMAVFFRRNCQYPRQRKISLANVDRLVHAIEAGHWIPCSPIRIVTLPDGREWLVDGNHSCEAVIKAGIPVSITLISIACDNEDDAHRIYAAIDTAKPRNMADFMRAMGDDDGAIPFGSRLYGAAGFILSKYGQIDTPLARDKIARREKALELVPHAEKLQASVARGITKNTNIIRRVPVLSVALATMEHQPEVATGFWNSTANDLGGPNDPHRAMLRALDAVSSSSREAWDLQIKIVILAWNAMARREQRRSLKPNAALSFDMRGVPVDFGVRPNEKD